MLGIYSVPYRILHGYIVGDIGYLIPSFPTKNPQALPSHLPVTSLLQIRLPKPYKPHKPMRPMRTLYQGTQGA